ncbi:MAG: RidA family protein [candidate division Zixibacteria bacterium]|nr:RidA family protein [candidate division Zixibacteria bacterium]
MSKKCVSTDKAPRAIGPYSQAIMVESGRLIFCSGQIPINPVTGKLIEGDITAQTEQVIENLKTVVTAAGSSLDEVVKTTVYLKNMDDFQAMNDVYQRYFGKDSPARAAVQVARLPLDVDIEIEAVAVID